MAAIGHARDSGRAADVAFFIDNLYGHGTQKVVSTLANAWAESGREVCVITLTPPETDFYSLDHRVRRLVVGGAARPATAVGRIVANLRRLPALRRALRKACAPILATFLVRNNVLALVAGVGLGLRIVISERNDPARQNVPFLLDLLRRLLYRRAALVTSNSRGVLETLKVLVPEERLAFVPNPLVGPNEAQCSQDGSRTILAVGRLTRQKAFDILLEAFTRLPREASAWNLAIIGEGELKQYLEGRARELGIADRVVWHGQVSDPFRHYCAASIFALPSRYEGTPNALLEAMSCGLAVVVSDASAGPLEYVEHGVSGLVVPVGDPESLAAALSRLVREPELRRRLGVAASERVEECALPSALQSWERALGLAEAPCGAP